MNNIHGIYQVLFLIDGSSTPYACNINQEQYIERSILNVLTYIHDKSVKLQWAYKFYNGKGKNYNFFKDFDEHNFTEFLNRSKAQYKPILPKSSMWLKTLQNAFLECISSYTWDEPDVLSSPVKSSVQCKKSPIHYKYIFIMSDCPQTSQDIAEKFNSDNMTHLKIGKQFFSTSLIQKYKQERITLYWIDSSEVSERSDITWCCSM